MSYKPPAKTSSPTKRLSSSSAPTPSLKKRRTAPALELEPIPAVSFSTSTLDLSSTSMLAGSPNPSPTASPIRPDFTARLENIENPLGSQPLFSKANAVRLFKAINASRVRNYEEEVFNKIWGYLGAEGLSWLLLAGIHLTSAWISQGVGGRLTREAISTSQLVTVHTDLLGLYLDLGPQDDFDPDYPYLGSGVACKTQTVPGLGVLVRGLALRVIAQHEDATYRERNPSRHYKAGYMTSAAHSYAVIWGMSPAEYDAVLAPIGLATTVGRCILIAYVEAASIALLSFFSNSRSRANLERYGVSVAALQPTVCPTNRETGLEPKGHWDSSSEAQADRGRRGGPIGGKRAGESRANAMGLGQGETLPLSDYLNLLSPDDAHVAHIKGASMSIAVRQRRQYEELLQGEKSFPMKKPAEGQYRLCEDRAILDQVAQRLFIPSTKVKNVSIPVPTSLAQQHAHLIKQPIKFKVLGPMTPTGISIQVKNKDDATLFTYSKKDLPAGSQKKIVELITWFSIMAERPDVDQ